MFEVGGNENGGVSACLLYVRSSGLLGIFFYADGAWWSLTLTLTLTLNFLGSGPLS